MSFYLRRSVYLHVNCLRSITKRATRSFHVSSSCLVRRKRITIDELGSQAIATALKKPREQPVVEDNMKIFEDLPKILSKEEHEELLAIERYEPGTDPEQYDTDRPIPGTHLLRTVREYQLRHPDWLILTRVGDFYEVYYEQADEVGAMLDMTVVDRTFRRQLTRFTGFPARQLERHLQTLVRQYKRTVAICEQFQDPVTRRFERKIDQVISPGTIIGQEFHDTHENNFLLAITTGQQLDNQVLGLAWIDISTGDFFTKETTIEDLETDLAHIRPSEILIDARLRHINEHIISRIVAKERHIAITYRPLIDTASASKILHELNTSGSRTQTTSMSSRTGRFVVPIHIEDFTAAERLATAFIVDYINQLYPGRDTNLNLPERYDASITMRIDRTVIQSLELVRTLDENTRKGSLLHTIDRTTTKAGARLLYLRMVSPSMVKSTIDTRLDMVERFYTDPLLAQDMRNMLEQCKDIQRSLQKLSLRRGGPSDLLDILHTIRVLNNIRERLLQAATGDHPLDGLLYQFAMSLNEHKEIKELLESYIPEDAPKQINEHGFIQPDVCPQLAELHKQYEKLCEERNALELELQAQYDIPGLRLLSHPTLRYYIEVTPKESKKMEAFTEAVLIQTLKGKRRYQLASWTRLGLAIDAAKENILNAEREILEDTIQKVLADRESIVTSSQLLAELDVSVALATVAHELGFTRPKISESNDIFIKGGRHPVVDVNLLASGRQFTRNDCHLSDDTGRIWLITGPNMGGKSTFLRQNAIITLLAQMGSFVPADEAVIGIVDRIFTRIGAADNLAKDQSTFMTEMLECAEILNHATTRSLVIMDEIGRGTATSEGMAIAYAALCYLHHRISCRTLFATHYHELADKLGQLSDIACYCTTLDHKDDDSFVYLHRVVPGVSTQSYGVVVAKMAGLPAEAIEIANRELAELTQHKQHASSSPSIRPASASSMSMPLHNSPTSASPATIRPFTATPPAAVREPRLPPELHKALVHLSEADLAHVTPWKAHEILSKLQALVRNTSLSEY